MEVLRFLGDMFVEAWESIWPRWAFAAGGFVVVYILFRAWFKRRKIQDKRITAHQIGYEVLYSVVTLSVTNLIGISIRLMVDAGYAEVLTRPIDGPTFGLIVGQFLLYFFLFDFYYYWLHRLMHTKVLFWVHRYHHHTTNPNPLTAFSFHPIEGLLTGGFVPLMILVFNFHVTAIIAATTFGVISSVLVHCGHEVFPRWWYKRNRISRFWISPMFHDRHHVSFRHNYGAFTTIWDRVFKTVEPTFDDRYVALHDQIAKLKAERRPPPRAATG